MSPSQPQRARAGNPATSDRYLAGARGDGCIISHTSSSAQLLSSLQFTTTLDTAVAAHRPDCLLSEHDSCASCYAQPIDSRVFIVRMTRWMLGCRDGYCLGDAELDYVGFSDRGLCTRIAPPPQPTTVNPQPSDHPRLRNRGA
jgi:hypothetical protein